MNQRRWWTRIIESMNVRSNSLELIVRLAELDVAIAVGAVAVAAVTGFVTIKVAAAVVGAVTIENPLTGNPFDAQ